MYLSYIALETIVVEIEAILLSSDLCLITVDES